MIFCLLIFLDLYEKDKKIDKHSNVEKITDKQDIDTMVKQSKAQIKANNEAFQKQLLWRQRQYEADQEKRTVKQTFEEWENWKWEGQF